MLKNRYIFLIFLVALSFGLTQQVSATTYTGYSSASDGHILGSSGATYFTAHNAATGNMDDSFDYLTVGQSFSCGSRGCNFSVHRSFVFFDTSSIPDDATITFAILSLYGKTDTSVTDFDITVQNGQPTYPHDPLVTGDYLYSQYSGNGGTFGTASFSVSGYNDINLTADGISWIQKGAGAQTKLALLSSRDISLTGPSGNESVVVWSNEKGVGYQPKLVVNYTVPDVDPPAGGYKAMSSSNYAIQNDSINFAGNLSTSTSYNMQDTLGEIATGVSSSTNYVMNAGYQQMLQSYISISSSGNPAIPNMGGISAGTGYASTTWTVTTDNPAGYSLSINASQSPAMQGQYGDNIADYVPAGAVPDYDFTVAATSSTFGFNPLGVDVTSRYKNDGSSTCGTGTNNTIYKCWDGLSTLQKIIAQSTIANQPSGATTTAIYGVKIGGSKIQTSGNYSATITVTAVTL